MAASRGLKRTTYGRCSATRLRSDYVALRGLKRALGSPQGTVAAAVGLRYRQSAGRQSPAPGGGKQERRGFRPPHPCRSSRRTWLPSSLTLDRPGACSKSATRGRFGDDDWFRGRLAIGPVACGPIAAKPGERGRRRPGSRYIYCLRQPSRARPLAGPLRGLPANLSSIDPVLASNRPGGFDEDGLPPSRRPATGPDTEVSKLSTIAPCPS
jgi:hypothetical protein